MRLVFFNIFIFGLASCNTFSTSQEQTLSETRLAISSVINLRDGETEIIIPKIDSFINLYGNKDRFVYQHLTKVLNHVDEIKAFYINQDSLISIDPLKSSSFYVSDIPSLNSPKQLLPFRDSILVNSWTSKVKYLLVNDHASMIGTSSCGMFNKYQIVVEQNANAIIQGQPYKASIYLGVIGMSPIMGQGINYNKLERYVEVKFLPDQSQKAGVWKGYHINRYDTTVIEIPYEIVDCL